MNTRLDKIRDQLIGHKTRFLSATPATLDSAGSNSPQAITTRATPKGASRNTARSPALPHGKTLTDPG
ncbi:MAG: hypothetical protein MUE97_02155 [Phycisphaerales bacterium]|nr:hypothetical protein [Phycisphaerales bacterium]